MSKVALNYDLLLLVLDTLIDDLSALHRCSLVNWEFNRTASRFLYSHVVLAPQFANTLSLRRGAPSEPDLLSSAALPHNAPHVLILRVKGYISPRPPPLNSLADRLLAAVHAFANLHTVELAPETYHDDLFSAVLPALKDRSALVDLRVNSACTDDMRAPLLVQIGGLRRLALQSPSRAILLLLPDWLGRLTALQELHLTRNCGSVTPGVLRSFIPYLTHIKSFSLGLSYSITDDDLFAFLSQLPLLEAVELQYYVQLKAPAHVPALPRLRAFSALHPPFDTRADVDRLCKWARRALARSPLLERVRLSCSDDSAAGAHVAFTGLAEHLARTHAATLRRLDLGASLVGTAALALLCARCAALEELVAGVAETGFASFRRALEDGAMPRLHTAVLRVHNARRGRFAVSAEEAAAIMQSSSALRRLAVNATKWESSWVFKDDETRFEVREWTDPVFPWK